MAVTTTTGFDLKSVPPEYRDQMEGLIPSETVEQAYTNRVLPGGVTDFEMFDSCFRTKHNILMVGPSGSGKTLAARAYAAHKRLPYVSVEFNGAMDPQATMGGTQVDPNTGLPHYKYGEIALAIANGGIIDLSEVNFAPPRFTAAFHGVLDHRQNMYIAELGTRIPKHPSTLVFASYNKKYVGTTLLNEAFLNRFAYTMPWEYDPGVEEDRVGQYSPTLLETVRRLRADEAISGDIGTNTMEEFIIIAQDLDNIEAATWLFLNKLPDEDRAIAAKVMEAEADRLASEIL